jgi:hypothetical protein
MPPSGAKNESLPVAVGVTVEISFKRVPRWVSRVSWESAPHGRIASRLSICGRDLPNAGGRNRSPACCYADEAHGDRSDLSQAEHKQTRAGALDLPLSRRDNVFVERLWRSVKYEEVYLRAYESVAQARAS